MIRRFLSSGSEELKSLTNFAGLTLVRQLVGFSAVFVGNVFASAHMTASAFATYVAALNLVFLLSGISTLGIFPTVLYQLSRDRDCTRYCCLYLIKSTTAAGIVAIVGLVIWQYYTGRSIELSACVATAALVFSSTLPAVFIALHRGSAYNLAELSWQLIYLILVLALRPTSFDKLMWIFAFSSMVRTGCYFFFLFRIPELWTEVKTLDFNWSFFRDASIASVGYLLLFRLSFYIAYLNVNGSLVATGWSWLERLFGLASAANSILNAKVAGGAASGRTISVFVGLVVGVFFGAELVLASGALVLERVLLDRSYSGLALMISLLAPGFLIFILRSNLQSVLMGLGRANIVRSDTVVCALLVGMLLAVQLRFASSSLISAVALFAIICGSTVHYVLRVRNALKSALGVSI